MAPKNFCLLTGNRNAHRQSQLAALLTFKLVLGAVATRAAAASAGAATATAATLYLWPVARSNLWNESSVVCGISSLMLAGVGKYPVIATVHCQERERALRNQFTKYPMFNAKAQFLALNCLDPWFMRHHYRATRKRVRSAEQPISEQMNNTREGR